MAEGLQKVSIQSQRSTSEDYFLAQCQPCLGPFAAELLLELLVELLTLLLREASAQGEGMGK